MRFRAIFMCFFCAVLSAQAQTWITRSEITFDFSRLKRLESGPPGHVYALDDKMNLALIRFDTSVVRSKTTITATVVKVLPLQYWPGFEKEKRHFDFSSVSGDGRHLALALTSKKITGSDPDGTPVLEAPKEEIFQIDFADGSLEFRKETKKRTASIFFGQSLRYAEYPDGNCQILAKDPEEKTPRLIYPLSLGNAISVRHPARHQSQSNEGFTAAEKYEFKDDLQQMAFRLDSASLQIESPAFPPIRIGLPARGETEIFRFFEACVIIRPGADSAWVIHPGKGIIASTKINEAGSNPIDHRACLLNGHILTGFSKGSFSFLNLRDGSRSWSRPVSATTSRGTPAAAMQSGAGLLQWPGSGLQYRFFPRGREFGFSKIASSETSGLQPPILNSKKFRIRTTRFLGDSSADKSDSRYAPGIFLNGIRFSSYYGNSIEKFIKLDISEKAGLAFLSYYQHKLLAVDPACKQKWVAQAASPVTAVKADESGQSVYTFSETGVVDFWNAKTGKKYLSLVFDSSGKEWLLWTPSGYFDASEKGEGLLYWMPPGDENRFPGIFSMETQASRFRKPSLVDAAMLCRDEPTALKRLKAAGQAEANKVRKEQLPPEIYLSFPGDRISFSSEEAKIPYFQVPGRKPVKIIQVLVDGKPQPEQVHEESSTLEITLPKKDCLLELIPVSAAGHGDKIRCLMHYTGKP